MTDDTSNKLKILIADDTSSIRKLLSITFEKAGFEVVSAADGHEVETCLLGYGQIAGGQAIGQGWVHDGCRRRRATAVPVFQFHQIIPKVTEQKFK